MTMVMLKTNSKQLHLAADEMRDEGYMEWGNVCEQAADAIDAHLARQSDGPSEEDVGVAAERYLVVRHNRGSHIDGMRAALAAAWHNRPAQKLVGWLVTIEGEYQFFLDRNDAKNERAGYETKIEADWVGHEEPQPVYLGAPYISAQEKAEPVAHHWDEDGEHCLVCGDKDWMGGPCSGPRNAPPAERVVPDARGMAFVDGMGWVVQCSRADEYVAQLLSAAPEVDE